MITFVRAYHYLRLFDYNINAIEDELTYKWLRPFSVDKFKHF